MAQVYNKIYVDVRQEVTDIVTAVQKDANSRFLDVYLLDNGLPINLTGHEVRIYGKKYDGTEIYNDGEITDATSGRCQFELTDQALALAQDLEVQIVIYYNNVQILQSFPFTIHVKKSLISTNAIESSNEYGALVVLFQNLYEAYDLMTTMVRNIGVPGEIAEQLTIDTMWDAWEYLCNYVSEDLTTLIQNALNNNSVDGVMQKLGNSPDTGGTATAGTVFAKLNKLIEKNKSFKHFETSVAINQTDYTVLSVTGAGEFYGLYGIFITTVKVVVDGVEFYVIGNANSTYGFKPSISNGLSVYYDSGTSSSTPNDYVVESAPLMPFKNSLVIKVSSGANIATAKLSYALYE